MKKNNLVKINFIVGLFSQIAILALGLIVPKLILNSYGSDTNGLTSTITQVFAYIALLQAGISASTRNVLYKPIQEDDREEISRWMTVSRKYYRRISYIYMVIIVLFSFGLPFLLKTNVSYWTVFFYVFFEGMVSVVELYFIGCWNCLLYSTGKTYVINTIAFGTKILCYCLKILLAVFCVNIAFIQVGYFLLSLIQLAIYAVYMKRTYSWVNYNQPCANEKLPDKNAYIVSEICSTIFSSTDMIVLSIFVSTSLSSVYAVYNMVFVALNSLVMAIFNALSYSLGQTYHKDIDEYRKLHDSFNSFFIGLMTVFMSVSVLLIGSFVNLYTKGVNDINYHYALLPICFCLIQLFSWGRFVSGFAIGVAGYQKKVVWVNVVEAAINITLSIGFVIGFGIVGVVLATVIALPLKLFYMNFFVERGLLKRRGTKFGLTFFLDLLIFLVCFFVSYFVEIPIDSYFAFIGFGFAFTALLGSIVFVVNFCVNKNMFYLLRRK